jgi:hypothetical protein
MTGQRLYFRIFSGDLMLAESGIIEAKGALVESGQQVITGSEQGMIRISLMPGPGVYR